MSIKNLIRKYIGDKNITYVRSFFPNKEEKIVINKRKIFYAQFLKKGDLYFDVGANYGNRIEPIIGWGVKIIAIEPQVECIEFLIRKYGRNITVIHCGLGDKKEERTMYISNNHLISSFSKEWINATKNSGRFRQFSWNEIRVVDMTTLDILISIFGIPKFIKIDVEGFEFEVLKGLSRPVKNISFEYTVPERKDSVLDCITRLVEITHNKVLFNYSIGESMEWALKDWMSHKEFIYEVKSEKFVNSGFGDIYVNYGQ